MLKSSVELGRGLGLRAACGLPVPHVGTEVCMSPRATRDRQLLGRAGRVRRGRAWSPGLGSGAEGMTWSGEQL